MANECTLVYETDSPINFTIASATAVEKGAILKLTDPMTVDNTAGDHDVVAGIAAEEHVANSGITQIAVYRGGVFKGVAGTAGVTVGCAIDLDSATSAPNKLADAAVNAENIVGTSFETATAGETFFFELKPIVVNLA